MLMGMLSGGLVIHGVAYLELQPSPLLFANGTTEQGPFMCNNPANLSLPAVPCGPKVWCASLDATGLKVTP